MLDVCACFATYFICHFIVWACWLHILLIRGHPFVDLIVWLFLLLPNGWTRMPKDFLKLSMLLSSQTLFMLYHKVWSSQIRTTLCEEHTESPIRHRLKLPKPLCAFRSDRSILSITQVHWVDLGFQSRSNRFELFGHTELPWQLEILHLGATELFHSVTPTGSGYI